MMLLIIWTAVLVAAMTLYLRQLHSRFDRYGVKYFTPLPLVGNMSRILLRRSHLADELIRLYRRFSTEKFVGRFEFTNELVMIRDVELVKRITIQDFEHFADHRSSFVDTGSFFQRNLFFMRGQEWKDMRSTLSPMFTASKIRWMVPLMIDVGNQMIKTLTKKLESSEDGYIDMDCKDLTTRNANDIIASCVFGLNVDSHTDENNGFYENGKNASTFKFRQLIVFLLNNNFPRIVKLFKINLFSESIANFFRNIMLINMKEREKKNIIRPDIISLLMEAKKGKLIHEEKKDEDEADTGFATVEESLLGKQQNSRVWSDDVLIAQGALFFIAGFEGVSSSMSFLLYELAMNTEVQERLAQEIREHDMKHDGKLDFSSIQNMPYMDMVVSELLRLWSPGVTLDRVCLKDYNIGKPNDAAERDFIIRKGTGIIIPVCAFHRDSDFFPNPEKFDPERFSDKNKHKIKPFTYMPFGTGPRNCIGSRFALCELKVMTYQILQHMVISPCEKTSLQPELTCDTMNLKMKGGHWLRFRARIHPRETRTHRKLS